MLFMEIHLCLSVCVCVMEGRETVRGLKIVGERVCTFIHTSVRMRAESERTCMSMYARTLDREKVTIPALVLGRQPGEPV